jgi:hypothetical protein
MTWERRGSRYYCYRAERVGGRVRKTYVGFGLGVGAGLISRVKEVIRADRAEERAKFAAVVDEFAALEGIIAPLDDFARSVAEAAILAAGYHRPKRGPWRKRRGQVDPSLEVDPSREARPADSPGPGCETRGKV